ncbi:zinc transporter ZntB [Altererythrobacter aquiaggeris]|uniref:zinc transporter ZntB n=1 Tax=Aestuarierythrobacter aquiaggeris TaxID=1898396 RepID=UPI00301653E9
MIEQNATDWADGKGPLIFGRVLDGNGGGRPIEWEEAANWKPGAAGEVLWVHLRRDNPEVRPWLEGAAGIPPTSAALLVSDSTRPRAFREDGTLVATLRGINFNADAQPEDMISLQLWCDGARLVTLRRAPMQTPRDVLALLDSGRGPCDAAAAITQIVEQLVARMNQSIVDMNDNIDRLEDADPDENTGKMLEQIASIRRNTLALKRHMSPQHEALEKISRDAPDWFEDHDRREIAETIDRLRRYLDDLDISKESALVLQDDIRARALARSDRTNYLLTIVAAIFLPLGFLTGLLGINVGGIPGVDDPHAFWIVVAGCSFILIALLMLFKWWKWL